jgi:hypothetical protein
MFLRNERTAYSRRIAIVAAVAALVASVLVTSPLRAAGPTDGQTVRALELQGFLVDEGSIHFLGVEPAEGAPSIVLTLVYRTPDDALVRDGVNFSVLSEEGMQAYLLGASLANTAVVQGSVLRAGPDGTIVQAAFHPEAPAGYTVIVHNDWHTPTRYMLSAHGGTLVDEGRQTVLTVPAQPEPAPLPEDRESFVTAVENSPPAENVVPVAATDSLTVDTSIATDVSVSGSLHPQGDRYEFALQPDGQEDEVTVRLDYRVDGGFVSNGVINFSVLTQDGLRHVKQGALLAELNLASGRADAKDVPGTMSTTIRLAADDTYAVVVYNDSGLPADFTLHTDGARLMVYDKYELAAGLYVQPEQTDMAVAHP